MTSIVIADYGIGNLLSVERAVSAVGGHAIRSSDPEEVRRAERLIVPGVGAFGDCMAALTSHNLVEPILETIRDGRPVLGICVGMQMLMEASEEFGQHRGLGVIPGVVRRIADTATNGIARKIPHIGWSGLVPPETQSTSFWQGTVLQDVRPGEAVYFLHSYSCEPTASHDRLADALYDGRRIAAAIRRDNVTGTQFHPEKSGPVGLAVLSRLLGKQG